MFCASSADVDVLQVDAASITSSTEDHKRGCGLGSTFANKHSGNSKGVEVRNGGGNSHKGTCRGGTAGNTPAGDDLRNYAYEGEGSSPGSLSSCKSNRSQ